MTERFSHTFRLLLNDARAVDDLDVADRLFDAGFGDVGFGVQAGVAYADVERDGDSFELVVLDTLSALEAVVEGLFVVRVEPDELVTASRIAERTNRTRQSVGQLISGVRGPGTFPAPVTFIDSQTRVWRWSAVRHWFRDALNEPTDDFPTPQQAEFLAGLNGALGAREHLSRYRMGGGSKRHADRVAALVNFAGKAPSASGRSLQAGASECGRDRPPEADALLHLATRLRERSYDTRRFGQVSDLLGEAIAAYDASILLHTYGRHRPAQTFYMVVLDAATHLRDARHHAPGAPFSALCPASRSAIQDIWSWKDASRTRPQVAVIDDWLRDRTLEPRLAVYWHGAFEALAQTDAQVDFTVQYCPGEAVYADPREEAISSNVNVPARFPSEAATKTLYMSFALTQALSAFDAELLHPDEHHLLNEVAAHVQHELRQFS